MSASNDRAFPPPLATWTRLCAWAQVICSKAAAIPDEERGPLRADERLLALLAQLPFLENSRPVHRQLLSSLQHLPPRRFSLFQDLVLDKVSGWQMVSWNPQLHEESPRSSPQAS